MALPAKIILTTSFRSDFLYMSAFVRYNEKIIDNSEWTYCIGWKIIDSHNSVILAVTFITNDICH